MGKVGTHLSGIGVGHGNALGLAVDVAGTASLEALDDGDLGRGLGRERRGGGLGGGKRGQGAGEEDGSETHFRGWSFVVWVGIKNYVVWDFLLG